MSDDGDYYLPFEKTSTFEMELATHVIASAITVKGGYADTEIGKFPALVFQFVDATTKQFITPITLILPVELLKEVSTLVKEAVKHSIKEIQR